MRLLKNQKGVSLPEIMTVIAIAGILASMAYTSFSNLVRRQKKTQARAMLGELYAQMTSFRLEWQSYYGRFKDIPFGPVGVMVYNVGFAVEGPAVPAHPVTGTLFAPVGAAGQISTRTACGAALDIPTCEPGTAPAFTIGGCTWGPAGPAGGFTACAEGDIGGTATDQWTIDEAKLLQNIRDGSN